MKIFKRVGVLLLAISLLCCTLAGCDGCGAVNTGTLYKKDEWKSEALSGRYYEYDEILNKWQFTGKSAKENVVFGEFDTYSLIYCEPKKSLLDEENILVGVSILFSTEQDAEFNLALVTATNGQYGYGDRICQTKVTTQANTQILVNFEFNEPITDVFKTFDSNGVCRFTIENRTFVEYNEDSEVPSGAKKVESGSGAKKYYHDDANGGYADIKWKVEEINLVIDAKK